LPSVTRSRRKTDRENATIGLAWQIESRGGKTIVWHNGMTGGYAAFAGFTSDGTRGVVVLSNISRDVAPVGFAALVPQEQVKFPKEIALEPKELASYGTLPARAKLCIGCSCGKRRPAGTGDGTVCSAGVRQRAR